MLKSVQKGSAKWISTRIGIRILSCKQPEIRMSLYRDLIKRQKQFSIIVKQPI